MNRARFGILAVVFMFAGCTSGPANSMVFLTRDGCVNTTTMRTNLDAALASLGRSGQYAVIDVDTLPPNDARIGYGTPTVLVDNTDLFGMPEPGVPAPPAT